MVGAVVAAEDWEADATGEAVGVARPDPPAAAAEGAVPDEAATFLTAVLEGVPLAELPGAA